MKKVSGMKYYIKEWGVLAIITVLIWMGFCIMKGLPPFGRHMIDAGDMGEQFEPMYYFIWDVLHGNKNLFFDWRTSLGSNMSGAIWHFGMISPFNVFFLFIPREMVVVSMPYYILIKLIFIGFSMDYVLQKWFQNVSGIMRIAVALMYVFCVYNMEYYRAPLWLDVVFMFPLVIYELFRLLLEGKKTGYVLTLSIIIVMNFQHAYMLALMLILLIGILSILDLRVRDRLTLLIGMTMETALLTAIIWVPGVLQILSSKRVGRNMGVVDIWKNVWIVYPDRWLKLIGLGIPLGLFIAYALKDKHWKKEKAVWFFTYILFILFTPFVFESIHIFWHGGSYQGYPIRFGYMVAFWTLIAGTYAISKYEKNRKCVGWVLTGSIFMAAELWICHRQGLQISFVMILLCVCMEFCAGLLIYGISGRILSKVMICYAVLHAIALTGNLWIYAYDKEDNFIVKSNEIYEQKDSLFEEITPLDRIRSKTIVSNNYSLPMGVSAMSSYLAITEKERQDMLIDLGYASIGDRLSDYGGTAFSDMLLGIDYVFSEEEENTSLYSKIGQVEDWNLYRSNYCWDTGILLKQINDIAWKKEDPFYNQNLIAKEWFGSSLFDIKESKGNTITIETRPNSILYLYSPQMSTIRNIEIETIDSGKKQEKKLHSSGWDNGIQELGTWNGEKVTITVTGTEEITQLQATVLETGVLQKLNPNYGEISELKYSHTGMAMSLKTKKAGYVYLPIYYSDGWRCQVNGSIRELRAAANMIAIPVEAGNNDIKIQFTAPGLKVGICLSVVGALIILGCMIKGKSLPIPEREYKIVSIGMVTVWAAIVAVIYIGSVAYTIGFVCKCLIGG